ncbi:MAG: OmpH family outer membrane protein [Chthoniobacterales bacterium]|nr:OmpH family outer membrane protein [Chthoniobacterales bacterium]
MMFPKIIEIGLLVLFVTSFGAGETQAQLKIGTVDVNRVFKSYGKTKGAEAKLNAAKTAATKEFNDRADAYKKAVEEINRINMQIDQPALSAEAKAAKAKERDEKIAEIKNLEREITEFRQTREQQLQQEMLRMKEEIVREITGAALELIKAKKMDVVFDKSGATFNGFSPLLFSRESDDFTDDVIAALKKTDHSGSMSKGEDVIASPAMSARPFPAKSTPNP